MDADRLAWRRLPAGLLALALVAAATGAAGSGCDKGAGEAGGARGETVAVFAASSLTDVFEAVEAALDAEDGPGLDLRLGGSAQLVAQLEAGAPADLIATADGATMRRAAAGGAVDGQPVAFATSQMVIAVARGNPEGITGLADLARDGVLVSLAAPEVPAGAYARRVLAAAGMTVRPATEERSVRAVLTKVILGEVDAGIVYASDVHSARGAVGRVEIPPDVNVTAEYLVAAVSEPPDAGAARVVEFLLAPEGQRLLERFGFDLP